MSDDKLAFLDQPRGPNGRFAAKETPAAEPTPEPAPEPVKAPEPVAAEPTPAPAAPPASPEPAPAPQAPVAPPVQAPPSGHVPIAAILDEREKRQALQRELDELKRRHEEATRKPVELDAIGDPDGFNKHFEDRLSAARFEDRANLSEYLATEKYGAETVTAAKEWLQSELKRNPGLWSAIQSSQHPYDLVVKQHKRAKQFETLGDDDLDAWFEKQAQARGYARQTPAPVAVTPTPQPQTPLPRPSLASAPAAGGGKPPVPTGPGAAFDKVFPN